MHTKPIRIQNVNVAGVNTSNSLRASDMYIKCQYLLERIMDVVSYLRQVRLFPIQ